LESGGDYYENLCNNTYWDGSNPALSPTFYDSVVVYPESRAQIPAVWKEKGIARGHLKIEKNSALWARSGVVSLNHAVPLGNGGPVLHTDAGPFLGYWEEFLLLTAVLYWTFRKRKKEKITQGPES